MDMIDESKKDVEVPISQENRKTSNEAGDENESSVDMAHFKSESSSGASGLVCFNRCRRGGTCRGNGRGCGSDVHALGVLSSARVVGTAGGCAGTGAALVNTFGVCFSADVVGHCLGVFGCIGRDIVAADARVGQSILEKMIRYVDIGVSAMNKTYSITGIVYWVSSSSRKLETNEGTGSFLGTAPALCVCTKLACGGVEGICIVGLTSSSLGDRVYVNRLGAHLSENRGENQKSGREY